MYRNLYIGKITGFGTDGYPVVTSFIKFYDDGITNVSMTFTKTTTGGDPILADDSQESPNEVMTGYKGTLNVLGISADAKALVEGLTMDGNGNLICRENGQDDPRFVMVYQGRNKKGASYQKWCYNVHISKSTTENANQQGSEQDISYSYVGNHITNAAGQYVYTADVLEGKTGWLAGATAPTTVYKEVAAA